MLLAQELVEGVDVWINTPKRPWEASGTSGMKVLVNGSLNVSVLDGQWAEAYSPKLGWAIGDGQEHGDDPGWDRADAEALYNVLENEIIPEFYKPDESGTPRSWVARMRESMALLTPQFSVNRTVREYTEEHYIPAAAAYAGRSSEAAAFLAWKEKIARYWIDVHFGALNVNTQDAELTFEVEVLSRRPRSGWCPGRTLRGGAGWRACVPARDAFERPNNGYRGTLVFGTNTGYSPSTRFHAAHTAVSCAGASEGNPMDSLAKVKACILWLGEGQPRSVLPHSNRKHTPGVKRDHQFFVRVHGPRGDAGARPADARSAGSIGLRIKFEPKPLDPGTDSGPNRSSVFTDPTGEHECLQASHGGSEGADLPTDAVHEQVEGLGRPRVGAGEQGADIAADSRYAQQAGLVVQHVLQLPRLESAGVQNVE
jgi:hypothetical protein